MDRFYRYLRGEPPRSVYYQYNPEIEERFGIDNFGPAIASRLAGFCEFLKLGGPDRRLRRVK